MKLISEKKKNRLGMLIAEAKFRAVNILETENERRFADTTQLIDKLNSIAFEIGGENFELIEISSREHTLRKEYERQKETEKYRETREKQIGKKSLLIIDTPESCGACEFLQVGKVGNPGWYCDRKEEYVGGHIIDSKRADFCPLRPLPEKNEKEYMTEFGNSYRDGWNDCIGQIE